jgi:hypothetical protein
MLGNIHLIRKFRSTKSANLRIRLSYLFANPEDGDELLKALTDLYRMRLKLGAEPPNARISPNNILTFDGFFGAKFDISQCKMASDSQSIARCAEPTAPRHQR